MVENTSKTKRVALGRDITTNAVVSIDIDLDTITITPNDTIDLDGGHGETVTIVAIRHNTPEGCGKGIHGVQHLRHQNRLMSWFPHEVLDQLADIADRLHRNDLKPGTRKQLDILRWRNALDSNYQTQLEILREHDLKFDRDFKYGSAWFVERPSINDLEFLRKLATPPLYSRELPDMESTRTFKLDLGPNLHVAHEHQGVIPSPFARERNDLTANHFRLTLTNRDTDASHTFDFSGSHTDAEAGVTTMTRRNALLALSHIVSDAISAMEHDSVASLLDSIDGDPNIVDTFERAENLLQTLHETRNALQSLGFDDDGIISAHTHLGALETADFEGAPVWDAED